MKKQLLMGVLAAICCASGLMASQQKPKMTAEEWFTNWRTKENNKNFNEMQNWARENQDSFNQNRDEHKKRATQWEKDKVSVEQWKNQEREWRKKLNHVTNPYLCQYMLQDPNGQLRQDLRESRKGWMPWISFKLRYLLDPLGSSTIREYTDFEKLLEEKIQSDLNQEIQLLEELHWGVWLKSVQRFADKNIQSDQKMEEARQEFDNGQKILKEELASLKSSEAKRAQFKSSLSFNKQNRKIFEQMERE